MLEIPLRWESPEGITVEKTYRFRRGRYDILVEFRVINASETPYSVANYLQIQRAHAPLERSMFNVDSYSFTGPVVYDGNKYEKLDVDDLEDGPFNLVVEGRLDCVDSTSFPCRCSAAGDGGGELPGYL